MKKALIYLIIFLSIFFGGFTGSAIADGPPPPPPGHSQNGNQASPGGTGCPIDRDEGMVLVVIFSLCYAGFTLLNRRNSLRDSSIE
jgi:hypothetical protein